MKSSSAGRQILVGDVGGTNTRLAIMSNGKIIKKEELKSADITDFPAGFL